MRTFNDCRETFKDLYGAVKDLHNKSERAHRGHGLDHDVTVAMLADRIAPDARTADMAWCAAMLHSVDRLVERGNDALVVQTTRAMLAHLPSNFFTQGEVEVIFQAAIRHAELNQDDQSVTQQVLQDADRLANIMPSVIIRAGQHHSELPALEFDYLEGKSNPDSTHFKPRSVLDDLRICLEEFIPMLRLPKAQAIGAFYARLLHGFINDVEDTNNELGLVGINL